MTFLNKLLFQQRNGAYLNTSLGLLYNNLMAIFFFNYLHPITFILIQLKYNNNWSNNVICGCGVTTIGLDKFLWPCRGCATLLWTLLAAAMWRGHELVEYRSRASCGLIFSTSSVLFQPGTDLVGEVVEVVLRPLSMQLR